MFMKITIIYRARQNKMYKRVQGALLFLLDIILQKIKQQ